MIFDIMSERDAVEFSCDPDILPCVIISIRNRGAEDVSFADNPSIKAIHHAKFFDSEEELPSSMQPADADEIARFVLKWYAHVESIVVHCTEGVSRSAGVCAALMRALGADDGEIFSDRRYRPNERCYRLTLAACKRLGCSDI